MSTSEERYKSSGELKELAKSQIKGYWGIAILVSFVAWLLIDAFNSTYTVRETGDYILREGEYLVKGSVSYSIWGLISFILAGPIAVGLANFFLKLVRKEEVTFNDLFSGFKNFLNAFLLKLLSNIFIFLWSLLLIIPGIIAAYRYSMAYYIMNDKPDVKPMDAIKKSKEMMVGHKGRLFILILSFIGWGILGIITLGIGFLWIIPYYRLTIANFYEDLNEKSKVYALNKK